MAQTTSLTYSPIGWCLNDHTDPIRQVRDGATLDTDPAGIRAALLRLNEPVILIRKNNGIGLSKSGSLIIGGNVPEEKRGAPVLGYTAPLPPGNLGDREFCHFHGIRYAYVVGAMANGITSVSMVEAAGRAGLLAFFGAGGLSLSGIDDAIGHLQKSHDRRPFPFGFNLIHSPADPSLEMKTVELYLERQVRLISASAFMDVTLPVAYYRIKGIHQGADGRIMVPNHVIAKVSREEVARKFLSPPPEKIITRLLQQKRISDHEANLARRIPMADDLTAEADSGGHTDNRPALSLLPTIMAIRDEISRNHAYPRPPGVGLGGGIGTPASTAAAFAMGAAFVLTGSVNQACIESGTSEAVRKMLADTRQADVVMAPAADMFELGVKVQVLKRGTLFPLRARKLYDLYTRYETYGDIPDEDRRWIETDLLKKSFDDEWQLTREFFARRDPGQLQRAQKSPRHRMALVFRSYLGQASTWANTGVTDRRLDYQIWCGPAMGAFNEWTRGSFLADTGQRDIVTVAHNFIFGAAVIHRCQQLRSQGIPLPTEAGHFKPLPLDRIQQLMKE
ncbi:MAG: 2-nitropropane dioxygenase [Deltaproteobacteria bacterium]|nr:MAG: 2-nitropropane dioxygenase [Deltaproteobacteria bacterium]